MTINNQQLSPESPIVQEAVMWMVKLQSGLASSEDWFECEQWQQQSPLHAQVWQQLESLGSHFNIVPKVLAHAALNHSANQQLQSRRFALKSILLLAGTGALAYSTYQFAPWQQVLADYGTRVGEQRKVMLADGTELLLNTDSAVDIHFNAQQRLVKLLKGEILITTGHISGEQRPFSIQTTQGNVRALGTRFLVRQHEYTTLVAVFENAVEVRPTATQTSTRLEAGQQLIFTHLQANNITQINQDLSAWSDGVIVAKNTRLVDFTKELGRYRSGMIVCEASIADWLISGVFPINDPERVLETLQRTLPIKAETRMRYWTILSKRN